MVDPLSGHTAAGNTLGGDGLRDGDALASPTLTNILQGLRGNGIIRLEDSAYGSTRNAVNGQPGAVVRATAYTLTVTGGYVVLDGQLYEFAGGPGGTATITLGSDGTGTALGASGEQSIYVLYLTSQGGNAQVHVVGGTPVQVSTGLYPSIPSQYLTNYDTGTTRDNQQVVVLATVRCQHVSSGGGNHLVDIQEVNDKRHFLRSNPIYMFPLTSSTIVTDGTEVSQVRRNAADGVQSAADLRGLFGSEPGKLGLATNGSTLIDAGAMWMSTSRSGAGVGATATITITAFTELNAGDKVNLVATDGTNYDFVQGDQSSVNGTFEATTSNNVTATNLMNVINTSSGPSGTRFTATVSGAVVTATQAVGGVAGNTTVTLTDSGTAGMTKTNFVGGTGYGFGPGDGLDRGTNQMKDELFFAGQNNTETDLVSKRLFSKGVSAPSFTDATCDYNNDPTITMDDTSSLIVGMTVTGTGIPTGATVASITNATTFELSAATTGGAVTNGTLTFGIIKASITYSITSYGDSVFVLNPASSIVVTLSPEKSGSNYLFPEGHTIEVVNSASSGGGNIVFDSSGLNSTVAPEFRATFIFEGSVWLRTAYETSTSAAATTFLTLTDTPSAFTSQAGKGVRVNSGANALEFYTIQSTLAGIDDQTSSNDDQLTITDTAVTINVDHDDLDFKVISDDNSATLHVDGAGAGKVGINQATPEMTFQVESAGFEYGTATSGVESSSTSTAIPLNLFHIQKFRSAKILVETENSSEEKYEVAEIVVTTPYKSDSTIGSDAEMPIQVYGVTSSDSADNAPGTTVVNTYAVFAESSNSNIQLRVTPAHSGDTVTVKAFWYAIGL